jgi:hypothetical protein
MAEPSSPKRVSFEDPDPQSSASDEDRTPVEVGTASPG